MDARLLAMLERFGLAKGNRNQLMKYACAPSPHHEANHFYLCLLLYKSYRSFSRWWRRSWKGSSSAANSPSTNPYCWRLSEISSGAILLCTNSVHSSLNWESAYPQTCSPPWTQRTAGRETCFWYSWWEGSMVHTRTIGWLFPQWQIWVEGVGFFCSWVQAGTGNVSYSPLQVSGWFDRWRVAHPDGFISPVRGISCSRVWEGIIGFYLLRRRGLPKPLWSCSRSVGLVYFLSIVFVPIVGAHIHWSIFPPLQRTIFWLSWRDPIFFLFWLPWRWKFDSMMRG